MMSRLFKAFTCSCECADARAVAVDWSHLDTQSLLEAVGLRSHNVMHRQAETLPRNMHKCASTVG